MGIVVLASGSGSNFEALARAFPTLIDGLICNEPEAFVLQRAASLHIPAHIIPHRQEPNRAQHEAKILQSLENLHRPPLRLVVLAGYMRILSPYFFDEFEKKFPNVDIINLHPAYLHEYKGAKAFQYALEHRFPRWGITVHKVIPEVDAGEVLATTSIPLYPWDTLTTLAARAHQAEHHLLVQTIAAYLQHKGVVL